MILVSPEITMPKNVMKAEECDATNAHKSDTVRPMKILIQKDEIGVNV